MSIPRSLLQTFAQQQSDGEVRSFGPQTQQHLVGIGPLPDPPGAVRVLRRDLDGSAMFWVDAEGRTCGGPNGPIASALPTWSELHGPAAAACPPVAIGGKVRR